VSTIFENDPYRAPWASFVAQRPNHGVFRQLQPITQDGVPRHHMQSVNQRLTWLPKFRLDGLGFNAYGEGWALYADQLGKEVGFYHDRSRITDARRRSFSAAKFSGGHRNPLKGLDSPAGGGVHAQVWCR